MFTDCCDVGGPGGGSGSPGGGFGGPGVDVSESVCQSRCVRVGVSESVCRSRCVGESFYLFSCVLMIFPDLQ